MMFQYVMPLAINVLAATSVIFSHDPEVLSPIEFWGQDTTKIVVDCEGARSRLSEGRQLREVTGAFFDLERRCNVDMEPILVELWSKRLSDSILLTSMVEASVRNPSEGLLTAISKVALDKGKPDQMRFAAMRVLVPYARPSSVLKFTPENRINPHPRAVPWVVIGFRVHSDIDKLSNARKSEIIALFKKISMDEKDTIFGEAAHIIYERIGPREEMKK